MPEPTSPSSPVQSSEFLVNVGIHDAGIGPHVPVVEVILEIVRPEPAVDRALFVIPEPEDVVGEGQHVAGIVDAGVAAEEKLFIPVFSL